MEEEANHTKVDLHHRNNEHNSPHVEMDSEVDKSEQTEKDDMIQTNQDETKPEEEET